MKSKLFFVILFIITSSCYPLYVSNDRQIANFLSFNFNKNTLFYKGKELGMCKILVYKVDNKNGFNSSYVSTYFIKNFDPKIDNYDFTNDTLFMKKNRFVIKVWDKNPEGQAYYYTEVNPLDWFKDNEIKFYFNTRH